MSKKKIGKGNKRTEKERKWNQKKVMTIKRKGSRIGNGKRPGVVNDNKEGKESRKEEKKRK